MGWREVTLIVGPGAPGKYFKEGEVGGLVGGCGTQSLNVGRLEQFGKDVGVRGGGGLSD